MRFRNDLCQPLVILTLKIEPLYHSFDFKQLVTDLVYTERVSPLVIDHLEDFCDGLIRVFVDGQLLVFDDCVDRDERVLICPLHLRTDIVHLEDSPLSVLIEAFKYCGQTTFVNKLMRVAAHVTTLTLFHGKVGRWIQVLGQKAHHTCPVVIVTDPFFLLLI